MWVIPKTVPAARLGKALGSDIPADGTRDLIMLTLDDGKHMAYPMILVAAIERVDPAAAAGIRTGERDLVLSHMSPRTRALADQADAAGAHAARIFTEMAAANGGTPTFQALPSLVREVAERFPRRAAAGQIDLCAHLSPAAPEPAFWCASDPGWLRCGGCLGDATDSIRGTEEDQRCDYCRRVSDRIHNEAGLMPPIVAELPGMLAASGPVMLMFGLCPDCHAEAFPDGSAAG